MPLPPPLTAAEMIRALELKPHPEGGHYRETFRDPRQVEGRPVSTAILFLLAHGERSHWHRIDAVEIWHYYAGAPLKLELVDGAKEEIVRLGGDIHAGEVPQVTPGARLAPAEAWCVDSQAVPWHPAFRSKASSSRPRAGHLAIKHDKTTKI